MKLLLGCDFSENAAHAARWAYHWASSVDKTKGDLDASTSELFATVVDESVRLPVAEAFEMLESSEKHQQHLDKVHDWLEGIFGNDPDVLDQWSAELTAGRPARALAELAGDKEADAIVLGMTGKGALKKLVIGSTAESISHRPPCPTVIVHPDDFAWSAPEVLVGIDFSEHSRHALQRAADFARATDGSLHLLHVTGIPTNDTQLSRYIIFDELKHGDANEQVAQKMEAFVENNEHILAGLDWSHEIRHGYPANGLLDVAEERDVDMLSLGVVGRSAAGDLLMGSVARSCVKHMPCTMMLSPRPVT